MDTAGVLSVERGRIHGQRITYRVDGQEVYLEANGATVRSGGDAALALALVPALRQRRSVQLSEPWSPELEQNLTQLQAIFASWLQVEPVPVSSDGWEVPDPAAKTAAFFSGGVDSFYTALTAHDQIDALIFVHGFDIPIDDQRLGEQALLHARDAAQDLGKDLVEVRTNIRQYAPIGQDWGFTHGAAMAFVAHSLAGDFGRVLIPSTYTYRDMFPWGSHPMTDPLWSGLASLVHHGAHATRMDKLALLADAEVAAAHLRVCWENRGGRFNCCECEKCVRTMLALRALGALDRFATFDRPLELNKVRFGVLRDKAQVTFTEQTLRQIEAWGTDPDLAQALRWRLRVGPVRHAAANRWARLRQRLGR